MTSLAVVLKKRRDIIREAREFGFEEVKLNRDFEDGLLFIVKKGTNPRASANYVVFLKESLEVMLRCEVTVTDETRIAERYKEEISEKESVNLDTDQEKQLIAFLLKDSEVSDPEKINFESVEFSERALKLCSDHKEMVKQALQGRVIESERGDRFFSLLPRVKRPTATRVRGGEEAESKKDEAFERIKGALVDEHIDSQAEKVF
jgi:hypothetical protein